MSLQSDKMNIIKQAKGNTVIPLSFSSNMSDYRYIINIYKSGYVLKKQVKELYDINSTRKDIIDSFVMYIENKDDLLEFLECYIDIEDELDEDVGYVIGYEEVKLLRGYTSYIKRHLIRLVNMLGKLYNAKYID